MIAETLLLIAYGITALWILAGGAFLALAVSRDILRKG